MTAQNLFEIYFIKKAYKHSPKHKARMSVDQSVQWQ